MAATDTPGYVLIELTNGVRTGWEHPYADPEKAAKRAERLNTVDNGNTYIVEKVGASPKKQAFQLTFTPHVIGFATPRLPLPGVVLNGNCPHCGADYNRDLGEFAACFPVANASFDFEAYCFECQKDWQIPLFIELRVRLPTPEDLAESARLEQERQQLYEHREWG